MQGLKLGAMAVLALCGVSLTGCASADSHWVELAGKRFDVEVVDTEAARQRGLMFRDHMDADHGMLFVFEVEQPLAFWMKNTRIPLDILYFDDDLRLVSIAANTPPCAAGDRCPSYPSNGAARFTLELNAGTAAALGVGPGAVLKLDPSIPGHP